ncbi:MAG: hypothetical protein OFPI_35840 [Osedax symbiont Rs2]|nr:MAG: hypothetical protein OFPI_35840 [Osedax symbiont Rs2]
MIEKSVNQKITISKESRPIFRLFSALLFAQIASQIIFN